MEKSQPKIAYNTYKKVSTEIGNELQTSQEWCVHVLENGKSRIVFFGSTQEATMSKAADWVNSHFDTPERRERMKRINDARAERKLKSVE